MKGRIIANGNIPIHKKPEPGMKITTKARKTEEIFRRTKVDSLVTMILQSEQLKSDETIVLNALKRQQEEENAEIIDTTDLENGFGKYEKELLKNGIPVTNRSSFQSVIMGLGETDFGAIEKLEESFSRSQTLPQNLSANTIDTSRAYLLLDIRDEDEYKTGHIITANNYPQYLLSRANHFETPEMVAYRNQPGKIIIIYDDNEKNAPRVVSTLVQRGYDNVSLLSGGLLVAYQKYPMGLVTGQLPQELIHAIQETAAQTEKTTRRKAAARSQSMPAHSRSKCIVRNELSQDDKDALRRQLQQNLLPKAAKSRVVKDTASVRNRNEESRSLRNNLPVLTKWY